jgi:hypothetical protein
MKMRFPTRLLLAILLAGPAALLLARAEPALTQPPQDAPAPGDQANGQQAAPDAADDAAQADPSEPASADVDAARPDESASVDGAPPWVFDTWCSEEGYRPATGWGISRDHSAGIRRDGHTHEGRWTVVRATRNFVQLAIDTDLGRRTLYFNRPNENDASQDFVITPGVRFERCGSINFNERF